MSPAFGLETEPAVLALEPSFLVVSKPCRLHSAPLPGGGPSLSSWVFERHPEAGPALLEGWEGPVRRPEEGGLVHRLDYETSGLLLFARSPAALRHFLAAQEAGAILKTYRAACLPSLAGLAGSRPLRGAPEGVRAENWASLLEASVRSLGDGAGRPGTELEALAALLPGRRVASRFRPYGPGAVRVACLAPEAADPRPGRRGAPERIYETEILALGPRSPEEVGSDPLPLEPEIRLLRGFRHQIRAHFAWIGLPLLGDELYGGAPAERLCLHASGLDFPLPESGLAFSIRA